MPNEIRRNTRQLSKINARPKKRVTPPTLRAMESLSDENSCAKERLTLPVAAAFTTAFDLAGVPMPTSGEAQGSRTRAKREDTKCD